MKDYDKYKESSYLQYWEDLDERPMVQKVTFKFFLSGLTKYVSLMKIS